MSRSEREKGAERNPSQMGRYKRSKGAEGERECVELLTAHGLDAERTYYQPGVKKADVDSLAGRFECKLRARFVAYDWLHDDVRGIYVRALRKPALIILRAEDAAKLFAKARAFQLHECPLAVRVSPLTVADEMSE